MQTVGALRPLGKLVFLLLCLGLGIGAIHDRGSIGSLRSERVHRGPATPLHQTQRSIPRPLPAINSYRDGSQEFVIDALLVLAQIVEALPPKLDCTDGTGRNGTASDGRQVDHNLASPAGTTAFCTRHPE